GSRGVRRGLGAPPRGSGGDHRRRDPVARLDGGGGDPGRSPATGPRPRGRAGRGATLARATGQVRPDRRPGRSDPRVERDPRHRPLADAAGAPRAVARRRDRVRDGHPVRGTGPDGVPPGRRRPRAVRGPGGDVARRCVRGAARRPVALPQHVAGDPHRNLADRRVAGSKGAPSYRRDGVAGIQWLVGEVLALARIDGRQGPESAEPIAVSDIIEASVAAVTPEAERLGVAVAVEPPPEFLVNAAPVAAKVALANILHNAVKFSPRGGQVKIVVTVSREEAVIAVSDTGPGVGAEEASRLFERFYRGSASRASDAGGVGLGLAISRALVERQGGRISVVVARANEATFSIHLPRA